MILKLIVIKLFLSDITYIRINIIPCHFIIIKTVFFIILKTMVKLDDFKILLLFLENFPENSVSLAFLEFKSLSWGSSY